MAFYDVVETSSAKETRHQQSTVKLCEHLRLPRETPNKKWKEARKKERNEFRAEEIIAQYISVLGVIVRSFAIVFAPKWNHSKYLSWQNDSPSKFSFVPHSPKKKKNGMQKKVTRMSCCLNGLSNFFAMLRMFFKSSFIVLHRFVHLELIVSLFQAKTWARLSIHFALAPDNHYLIGWMYLHLISTLSRCEIKCCANIQQRTKRPDKKRTKLRAENENKHSQFLTILVEVYLLIFDGNLNKNDDDAKQ